MGWKNLASWLRGGVIGVLVYIVATLICWLIGAIIGASAFVTMPSLPGLFAFNPEVQATHAWWNLMRFISITTLIYFLLGAIIGWIIGKIKSK